MPDLERQEPQRQHERYHHQPKANPGLNQFGAVVQIVKHAHGPEKRPDLFANGIACLVEPLCRQSGPRISQQPLNDRFEGRAASVSREIEAQLGLPAQFASAGNSVRCRPPSSCSGTATRLVPTAVWDVRVGERRRARQPGCRAPIPRPENLGDTSRVPWRKLAKYQKPRRGCRRGLGWQCRGGCCQSSRVDSGDRGDVLSNSRLTI